MDWLGNFEQHYIWLAIGLLLGAAEILVPGVFLPIGIPLQIVIFAVLAIIAVFLGKRYVRDNPIHEADPKMNRRGQRMVGETAIVVVPIEAGNGKVKIGDSEWLARGEDVAYGERVRITGSDGAILLVEKF